MVIQILSRVMEKLAQAGETVTGADDLQNIVQSIVAGTKEPLPGLLVLTQEHGEKCHELLENPKIREKYNTSCALLQENQVSMDGIEAVVLFNLTTDAMCKLASRYHRHTVHEARRSGTSDGQKAVCTAGRSGALPLSDRRTRLLSVHDAGEADEAGCIWTEDLPDGRAGGCASWKRGRGHSRCRIRGSSEGSSAM